MSYVDAIFERYWEEKTTGSSAWVIGLSPREVQDGSIRSPEDFRRFFCLEVDRAVGALEEREQRIVWWRHPPPGDPPLAWRRISKELRLTHPIPQRIYRRAARDLGHAFRAMRLRPLPRLAEVEEEEPAGPKG